MPSQTTATLLRPGISLMCQLRMPTKMALVGTLLLAPMLLSLLLVCSGQSEQAAQARAESVGAQLTSQLGQTMADLQTLRSLSLRKLSGDAQVQPELQAQQQVAQQHLAQLLQHLDQQPELAPPNTWQALQGQLGPLIQGQHPTQRAAAFAAFSNGIEAVRRTTIQMAERSGLLLDPVADTYFLVDQVIERTLPWREALSVVQSHGAALLARGDASQAERSSVIGRVEALEQLLIDTNFRLQALERAGVPVPDKWAAAESSARQFAQLTRDIFTAEQLTAPESSFLPPANHALQQLDLLRQQLQNELIQRLDIRADALQTQLWTTLGVSVLGVTLTLYLSLAFFFSFKEAMRQLHMGVSAIAGGDLSHHIDISGRDELARIGTVVESMSSKLSAMVAEIRSSAVRVGLSGQQVASSGDALAQRTDSQADSLRRTLQTLDQLGEAVTHTTAEVHELDTLTHRLRNDAEVGGSAMATAVSSVGQLESSSKRVGEIIGVIDGIAFQTNILALNAAVEAARAGEAGRGFAVVASEVRQLAQRSAAAAAEIRQLIQQSSEQVGQSVHHIESVGQTLQQIVTGVREVSGRLGQIAQSSTKQQQGLDEVSSSAQQLSELTNQNARMVEESSGASTELVARASALGDAVGAFRLRQGSADEARDLVHQALALVKSQGLAAATKAFTQPDGRFRDRDLYIFVVDRQGIYQVHGAKPAMQGHRVHEVPGIDGDKFVRDTWQATEGSHWVEYNIVNPESDVVQPKASYVVAIDTNLVLGCGIYRQIDKVQVQLVTSPKHQTLPTSTFTTGSNSKTGHRVRSAPKQTTSA